MKISVKNITESALEVSDNLVEGSLATGAKWQKISAKLMKEGTVLFGKQQDMTLSTLEEVKKLVITGNKRFINLLGINLPKVKKAAKSAKKEIEVKVAASPITKTVKKSVKEAKEAIATKSDTTKDDLRKIEGIGPKIATLFNQAGITTFKQIAESSIDDLNAILEAAGPRYKMHDPKTWVIQAKRILKE